MVRILLSLLLAGALGGCAASGPLALAGTPGCSVVTAMRMAMAGLPCRVPKPPPAPYCTRSLADVDCWQDPERLPDQPPQVADGGWEAPTLPQAPTGEAVPPDVRPGLPGTREAWDHASGPKH